LTITDHLRKSILSHSGYIERMPDLESLKQTEWCPEFEQAMRQRLLMGSFRYGRIKEEGKLKFDRLTDIKKRLELYEQTGNDEILVDIANLALMEFVEGNHPKKHFKTIDDGEHTHGII